MGAEAAAWCPPKLRTPSRLSNCGGMVSEAVLEQLETELRLEEEVTVSESPLPSPGGRKLLVGMKLNATCREMLSWTILDLAKPGDQIVAFHVTSFPVGTGTTSTECEDHFEQLASTLRGFLTIYEGLCVLKQIKLEVEILPGIHVKKVLVDFAKSQKTCHLILGSNKHFTARRNKSLGRYCLKRLPCTCSVVVLQHGEIILNEMGKLSRTDFTSLGAGVIKTLRRSMQSFGRSRKARNGWIWEYGFPATPRPSEASPRPFSFEYTEHSAELEECYFSDSSLFHSSLFQEFDCALAPSPKPEPRTLTPTLMPTSLPSPTAKTDMFLLDDHHQGSDMLSTEDSESPSCSEEHVHDAPGWPLMHHTIGLEKAKQCDSPEKEGARVHHTIVLEKSKQCDSPEEDGARAHHTIALEKSRQCDSPEKEGARGPQCGAAAKEPPKLAVEATTPEPSSTELSLVLEEKLGELSEDPRRRSRSRGPLLRHLSFETLSPRALQRRFSVKAKRGSSPPDDESPSAAARDASEPRPRAPGPPRRSCSSSSSAVEGAWLQRPRRSGDDDDARRDDYARALSEMARDAFVPASSVGASGAEDAFRVNKKVKFVLETPPAQRKGLAHRLGARGVDQEGTGFAYEDLKAATSDFDSRLVVGRGGGSEVYKGVMADGKQVAVKRLNWGPLAEEELLNDVAIHSSLARHPHIVTWLGYCVDLAHLSLVYEYLPEGNLEDRLHGTGSNPLVLPWPVRYKVAVGIAKALDYLHHGTARPVIHRDVKASNILLNADFEAQLSDFGLAKWAPKKAPHLLCDDILGTFGYLAPEYFMYGRVNNKTDVYAFGVVLLELITGRTPIDNTKPKGHENLVKWAKPLLKDHNMSELVDSRLERAYDVEQLKRMLLAASLCVRQSSQRRPQMSRVLQILCSSNHNKLQLIRTRNPGALEREDSSSIDLEESEVSISETPSFHECGVTDIKTHFALAMLGVEDHTSSSSSSNSNSNSNNDICNNNVVILRNSLDHRGADRLHSKKYLEAYLGGRYSPPSSGLVT